jgi:hypothetical protein
VIFFLFSEDRFDKPRSFFDAAASPESWGLVARSSSGLEETRREIELERDRDLRGESPPDSDGLSAVAKFRFDEDRLEDDRFDGFVLDDRCSDRRLLPRILITEAGSVDRAAEKTDMSSSKSRGTKATVRFGPRVGA